MIGQTLGHYRIVREIGADGMGVVYQAEDTTSRLQAGDPVLDQLPVQRFSIEAKHPRRGSLVSGCVAQRANDVLALDVGEPTAACPDCGGRGLVQTVGQIVDGEHRARSEYEGTLDHVLELAHVARPSVSPQERQRLG